MTRMYMPSNYTESFEEWFSDKEFVHEKDRHDDFLYTWKMLMNGYDMTPSEIVEVLDQVIIAMRDEYGD